MFKEFDKSLSPTRALVGTGQNGLRLGGRPFSSVFDAFFGDTLGDWGFDYGADQFTEVYLDETDDRYLVEVDLPGFELGDVSIEAKDGILSLTAEKKSEETLEGKVLRRERTALRLNRSLKFGNTADLDAASATLNAGVLKVEIPKQAEAKARTIEIKG